MTKLILLFFIVGSFKAFDAVCQQTITSRQGNKPKISDAGEKNFTRVVSAMQQYTSAGLSEKIHIQFNKSAYIIGDTAWFKVYVTNALDNRLSVISKVVYINLQSADGDIKKMILPVDAGMASAQFILSNYNYQAGVYKLIAYTNWMRNFGDDFFYTQPLVIEENSSDLRTHSYQLPLLGKKNLSESIDFFPEGGSLVSGIRSKIAFKASGKAGSGTEVSGYIVDENDQKVAVFKSAHAGIGVFPLTPTMGQTYKAVITEGVYKGRKFAMPKVLDKDFVLSVNKLGDDSILVRVSKSGIESSKIVNLLIQSNCQVRQALSLPMAGTSISFAISNGQLARGINQITLFSAENLPLAERLIFINTAEQVKTSVSTDKQIYESRTLLNLELSIVDKENKGIVGGYSIAVGKVDEDNFVIGSWDNIFTNLVLTSDLQDYIEKPNYYFTDLNKQRDLELDALMLTQKWSRFTWNEVLSGVKRKLNFKAEDGVHVSGVVSSTKGKPVSGAKVSFVAAKELIFLNTISDENGRFSFNDLPFTDSVNVILQAKDAKGSYNIKIVLDEIDEWEAPLFTKNTLRIKSVATDKVLISEPFEPAKQPTPSSKIIQGKTLRTVEIKTKRRPVIKDSV